MKRLTSKIIINNFEFTGVVDCEVSSSYATLTDTCKLTFPRKLMWKNKKLTDLIKRGDKVSIELGYDDNNEVVFAGYIKNIKTSIPVEITCEDDMYLLKQNTISKTFEKIDLSALLNSILPFGIKYECIDFRFNNFRISNATPAEVLDNLQKDFGLPSFFRGGKLYVGLNIWEENSKNINFHFQKDIIDPNNLEFQIEEDIKIKVVANSIDEKNKKITVEVGDKTGEQRTFYYYNYSQEELKKIAEKELTRLKYTGYKGTFSTFGQPKIKHGDTVTLTDNIYPEREGTYIVKSVNTSFGMQGFRQKIELDKKA